MKVPDGLSATRKAPTIEVQLSSLKPRGLPQEPVSLNNVGTGGFSISLPRLLQSLIRQASPGWRATTHRLPFLWSTLGRTPGKVSTWNSHLFPTSHLSL